MCAASSGARGPEVFRRTMEAGGTPVSRETLDRLAQYLSVLERWQSTINLVGRTTLPDAWNRHILDSAQIVPLLPPGQHRLADLGTGAGLPGLVVAAFRPDLEVILVESDARKAAFLGEAARAMALERPPRIVISRIEQAAPLAATIVTARALAPLDTLLAWADRHRAAHAICLFHKGRDWRKELTDAQQHWDIPHQPIGSATDRDAVILRIGAFAPADLRHR